MTFKDIVDEIKTKRLDHQPVIIAIEGFGGAGKSTFAANLKDELGDAYVVHIDDFFLNGKRSDADKSNFDRKRLEEQVLLPIKSGQPAAYQKIVDIANTLSEPIEVPQVKYLIIEGVSSFHPSIVDYMDYKIWIETPGDVAKARGEERDKGQQDSSDDLWGHWTATYQDYKNKYRPDEIADFVFDNSTDEGRRLHLYDARRASNND